MKLVTQVVLFGMFVTAASAGKRPSEFKRLFSKEKTEPSYYYDSKKDDYPAYRKQPSEFKRLFPKDKTEPSYYYDSKKDNYPAYRKQPSEFKRVSPKEKTEPVSYYDSKNYYPTYRKANDYKRPAYYDHYPTEPYIPATYVGYESNVYDAEPAQRRLVMEFRGNLKVYGNRQRTSRLLSSMKNRDLFY
ncbi:uncharacterized protein [Haliotis asinina]|uniref:uncharacterized protein n=1 Tax=Haliotis asinina TaxID=109174 RepID=UPI0035325D60